MSDLGERGFTLLEMVCVLAIIALLAAVLLPFAPHETSRSRLQAYALQTAALLKTDRDAAITRHTGARDPFRRVACGDPDSGRRPLRCAVAADLPAASSAVDHQLFRQWHVMRRHHRADALRHRL
jgi:prepilin-type N-terminal cleavage/methylation domain-containing protein